MKSNPWLLILHVTQTDRMTDLYINKRGDRLDVSVLHAVLNPDSANMFDAMLDHQRGLASVEFLYLTGIFSPNTMSRGSLFVPS
jgi:hypothetical protein